MPQGSSAVRPTNGLYLYLYSKNKFEKLVHLVFIIRMDFSLEVSHVNRLSGPPSVPWTLSLG